VPNRVEINEDLGEQVAAQIIAPMCTAMADAIRDDVKETGPLDQGLLRELAASEPAVVAGPVVIARYVSSRPADNQPTVDVAVFVEFGTKFMTPRRYSAVSARRAIQLLGYGRFDQASDPWPHK
jgi:hypothetical protein